MAPKIGYYPGCTLKTKAENLERSAVACLGALGIAAEELERWNCCGAVFSLADDDLIHHVAPVRVLVRAKDQGCSQLVTLCSMCYNTLARANLLMTRDEEKRATLNRFMDEETDYSGEVEVLHYLELLRRTLGWDGLKKAVKAPLGGLRVAPYYGCTLVRPQEVSVDDSPDGPTLFGDFLRALGAVPVDFPGATQCCGSYQIVSNEAAANEASSKIIASAVEYGAEAMALSCPVCEYSLGQRQPQLPIAKEGKPPIPTLYFTQLLALALGLPANALGLDRNERASADLLVAKGLVGEADARAALGAP